MKLIEASKMLGVTKTTLYNWRREGKIEFIKSITGRNHLTATQIEELEGVVKNNQDYARVSSVTNKDNLKTQSERYRRDYCRIIK